MALSTSNKITLICAFGAAILTGLILVGIREWYAPDIRYEEGSFYISGKNAITSLNLKNYGHSDAKDIIVSSHFDNNINAFLIEDKSLEVRILSGGIGTKNVIIKITRIVPDYMVLIYFSIDHNQEINSTKGFISNIVYDGGQAKTGKPIFIDLGIILILVIVTTAISGYVTYKSVLVFGGLKRLPDKFQKIQVEQINIALEGMICFIKSIKESDDKLPLNKLLETMEKIKNDQSKSSLDKIKELLNEMCNICKTINQGEIHKG